jgi:hypothetical protein
MLIRQAPLFYGKHLHAEMQRIEKRTIRVLELESVYPGTRRRIFPKLFGNPPILEQLAIAQRFFLLKIEKVIAKWTYRHRHCC